MTHPEGQGGCFAPEHAETAIPAAREGLLWYVAHTRPRAEKKLQALAERESMITYLPLRRIRRRYGARRRESWVPLFPGYVFCLLDMRQRLFLGQSLPVARLIDIPFQDEFTAQLRQVYAVVATQTDLDLVPYLQQGSRVTVLAGPFQGLEGIVQRVKNVTRVVLNIDIIQQSAAVEVDADLLEVVE